MAGFKYRKFTITGGSTEFPTSTTDAAIRSKEEYLVKHVADALIDMGIGWACDTDRNATTSDFVDVPKYSSTTAAPGLFLVNTISGCKFFLSYLSGAYSGGLCFYYTDGTTKIFDDSQVCTIYNSYFPTANTNVQGFLMSMIPEGSSNNFGASFNSSFLPSDATRIIGTAVNAVATSSSYHYIQNLVNYVSNGLIATVQVFATPYCVGIGNSSYGGTPYLASFCGRVLGDLTNPTSDTTNQAKYGVFTFARSSIDSGSNSGASDYNSDLTRNHNAQYQGATTFQETSYAASIVGASSNAGTFQSSTVPVTMPNYFDASTYKTIRVPSGGSTATVYARSTLPGNSVCLADGTWVCSTASHGVTAQVNGFPLICQKAFDATSNSRPWQPIAMIVVASDTVNDWAGIKGYLDTSLFRASPQFAVGTVLDSGNFICTEQGMITLGWDPTNPSW